MTLDVLK
jgi:Ca2+-binding EF-hand superfamily protein